MLCFQYKEDAEKVMEVLPKRFAKHGLTIHPRRRSYWSSTICRGKCEAAGEESCHVRFSRLHVVCAHSRKGKFTVHVRTMKKRFRRGLKAIADSCQENRHLPVEKQQKTLNAKLRGHYQYFGRPTNYRSIGRFFGVLQRFWHKWLSRRTRGNGMTSEKYAAILPETSLVAALSGVSAKVNQPMRVTSKPANEKARDMTPTEALIGSFGMSVMS